MPETQLIINLAGSAFAADLGDLRPWRPFLDSADSIALAQNGRELVRVELGGSKRWIAFRRPVGGSPFFCIGFQETVGAFRRGGTIVGGSNRKVLTWLHSHTGHVHIGGSPGG